jgi:two-component system, cell cycle sensor histidine kinase and response regulator CckA
MSLDTKPPEPAEPRRPMEIARLHMARLMVEEDHPLLEAFRRVCEIAAETLKVERVGIWLLTEDRKALRCANLFERTTREHSQGVTLHVAEFPEYFRSVALRRALPVEIARSDPRVAELRDAYLIPLGITSMLDASVIHKGEIAGIVCHEHVGEPRDWTTEDRDFAMSVADAVTMKMKWAELLIAKSALRHEALLAPGGDRFEVVGRLAAGVAHDFKNLLMIVLSNANLISLRSELPPDIVVRVKQIEGAAERGAELIRELIDFGREPNGTPRVVNVPEMIEGFLPLVQAAVGSSHPVELSREPGTGKVLIDRGNLERAILNVVLNARDAMPSGGPVRIRTAIEQAAEHHGPLGVYVRIDISDTGTGIALADREQIFEPFFTSKPEGKGTGLGLASVRRILDRAGGFVRVESAVGEGTTLRLYLPRVACDC